MEFGPLEYAILGNGVLLFLLFIILIYTIYRLRQISVQKRIMKERESMEGQGQGQGSSLELFSPDAPHQSFSTLCGLNGIQGPDRHCWSATLPLPPKKSVRIHETKSSMKSSPLESFSAYQPPLSSAGTIGRGGYQHQQAVWVSFPHHGTPFYPGSFATLNIPVKKKSSGGRCQRAHSCRMQIQPNALIPHPPPTPLQPIPILHQHHHHQLNSTLHKKINVDYMKY